MATILIVDDLAAHRKVLVTLLGNQGHRLLEAADGSQGLAAALKEHPDLVITDVLMPVMDGYELVRQLRLNSDTSGIPVLFYTAPYSEREARALAQATGKAQVLPKSAAPDEVLLIVAGLLSSGLAGVTPDPKTPAGVASPAHLRLLTDRLSERAGDLRAANSRLRALINIGIELASTHDSDAMLRSVCSDGCDLFGATYVTIGIVDHDMRVRQAVSCGADTGWIEAGDPVSGILAAVITERRILRGENPGGSAEGLQLPSGHPEAHAFLAAPIASPSKVYGWICLVSNEGRGFTEEDEDLVLALAGQVGRMYELAHEIQERRQAEASLRTERDWAQRYLDTPEVILLELDLAGRITLVNRYACAILGWTAAELVGKDWIDTCLPARVREGARQQLGALAAGDLSVIENPVLTKSGEERLIEWRNTVLSDDAGRPVATFSSGSDITERSQAVEALRLSEERMRYALQYAKVGIWDMDYATGVLTWSDVIKAQYGLPPGASFAGTFEAFMDRVHPDDREALVATIGAATAAGSDFSTLHRAMQPDGAERWLSGSGRVLLGPDGQPIRGIGISLDVTDRLVLEQQFQQAQKMEAIGQLAGGVAHDFNNLLTAILGYCELLLADLPPGDPHRRDIGEILKAGLSAAGLTRQLLAFSRKQIIEPTILDLNLIVIGMQELLGRLIGEDLKVVLALQPKLAPVKADRGQVEQVVLNLAVNARDAMPGGGTLTVETADVELDASYPTTHLAVVPGAYVVLTVTDTGCGMSREVQARLFEPFFTTKEVGKGTGLGLATVHGIIKQNGGSINVYSEPGRGTSFKVYFPRADAGEPDAEIQPPRPGTGTETILVVEDAEGLRELTRRLLERLGYTVLVAANAIEALGLFEQHPSINVLLTDVVMPGASGPELTRQLMELQPQLKVIYMSGYTEESIVHHGVIKTGIAFLHKPFTSETLARKLREVLDR